MGVTLGGCKRTREHRAAGIEPGLHTKQIGKEKIVDGYDVAEIIKIKKRIRAIEGDMEHLNQCFERAMNDAALAGEFSIKIDRLLFAVKLAYRKHHMQDDDIGRDELSEVLKNALVATIGEAGFVKWLQAIGEGKINGG